MEAPNSKPLDNMLVTWEERRVIEEARKLIYGRVEFVVRKREITSITKVVETYNLEAEKQAKSCG